MAKKAKFKDSVILSAFTYCTLALLQATFTGYKQQSHFHKFAGHKLFTASGKRSLWSVVIQLNNYLPSTEHKGSGPKPQAHQCSLWWASSIQSISTHHIHLRYILILSSHSLLPSHLHALSVHFTDIWIQMYHSKTLTDRSNFTCLSNNNI